MKANYRNAYAELKKMGCPVIKGGDDGEDTFRISGESNYDEIWADYYAYDFGVFGVNPEVVSVLEDHGLFAEWINPSVCGVYEI